MGKKLTLREARNYVAYYGMPANWREVATPETNIGDIETDREFWAISWLKERAKDGSITVRGRKRGTRDWADIPAEDWYTCGLDMIESDGIEPGVHGAMMPNNDFLHDRDHERHGLRFDRDEIEALLSIGKPNDVSLGTAVDREIERAFKQAVIANDRRKINVRDVEAKVGEFLPPGTKASQTKIVDVIRDNQELAPFLNGNRGRPRKA